MTSPLRVMTAADYHAEAFAEPGDPPMLSSSCAHTLLTRSPFHAHREHPRLGGTPKAATAEMDFGTVVHALLLDPSPSADVVAVLPFDNWRTDAAKDARKQLEAIGRPVMLEKEYAVVLAAVAAVRRQLDAHGVALTGQSEGVALWTEHADDGTPVSCRGRLDHWLAPVIDDVKTTKDGHPKDCEYAIRDRGYDTQCAAYLSAAGQLFPDLAGRLRYRWLFVEKTDPYFVTILRPSGAMLAVGRSKWRRAVNLWARCLASGHWPGYTVGEQVVSPTQWAMAEEAELSATPHEILEASDR